MDEIKEPGKLEKGIVLLAIIGWTAFWVWFSSWLTRQPPELVMVGNKLIKVDPWAALRFVTRTNVAMPFMCMWAYMAAFAWDRYFPGDWWKDVLKEPKYIVFLLCVLLYCVFQLAQYG